MSQMKPLGEFAIFLCVLESGRTVYLLYERLAPLCPQTTDADKPWAPHYEDEHHLFLPCDDWGCGGSSVFMDLLGVYLLYFASLLSSAYDAVYPSA